MGWFDNFRKEKREESLNEAHESISQMVGNTRSGEETSSQYDVDEVHAALNDVDRDGVPETVSNVRVVSNGGLKSGPTGGILSETNRASLKTYKEKKPIDRVIGETLVIAIINQKGGVGKSTTAVNLSAALGEMGKQVLLIDLDPQGNATSGLGVEKSLIRQCVYDVLLNEVPLEEVIVADVCEGLDLAPATINLAGAEVELVSEMARENRVKEAVDSMRGRYDYIFIDCPPSLGLLTVNALVGSDKLIIPIQTEFYALEGVTKLLESMKRVKTRLNRSLDIFGILLTMYDGRTTLSRQVASEVRNYFGDKVFETIIPRTVKLSEAPSYGIPICQYDPMGKGAVSYNDLAKEVISRG